MDSLVVHHRSPRNHAQRTDLSQTRNQRLGHPIGEVLLLRIAGEIFQRQNCKRFDAAWAGCKSPAEAIAASRQGLDVAWRFGRIAKRLAQPLDGVVKTLLEVNKRVGRPDPLLQLIPGDDLARVLKQRLQDLKRLFLEFDLGALFVQLCALHIHFEHAEANGPPR